MTETERYADKITESEDRCDVYCELQLWRKAFEVAAKLKDPNRLLEVCMTIYIYIYCLHAIYLL